MIDLINWKEDLPADWQMYALIDPLADNKPLIHWYQHAEKTDAWPLYAGTEFSDDILSGPWLLPLKSCPSWLDWWQTQEHENHAAGVLIASEHPAEQLVKHWSSLLIAGLDGEEVLFRYYDPRVLGPMLYTFSNDETRQFLGPASELVVWHNNDWLISSPYPEPDLAEHTEPWWRMKAAHFVGQPGEKAILINALDDWLWQNKRELMTRWLQHNDDVCNALSLHYDMLIASLISPLWFPSVLVLNLFNCGHWWPDIQKRISLEDGDEQSDILNKTAAFIEKYQQEEKGMGRQ